MLLLTRQSTSPGFWTSTFASTTMMHLQNIIWPRPQRAFITLKAWPGYRFRIVDRLLTNFHLPRSTLLMLVAAFAGYDPVMAAYAEAIRSRYRFYSYGDAMVIL